jgi:UDP-2-acetamido-3-amino-2,3-dideoxy-glucuronate N-acetyltransferase
MTSSGSALDPVQMRQYCRIADDVTLGADVKIYGFVNLYGCAIGDGTQIGAFVEVQKGATIGQCCRISSHTFICEGVHIGDEVFLGHGMMFTNVLMPRATNEEGTLQGEADWKALPTIVEKGASIGSGSVILCGITIGEQAIVGAGAVVTGSVPAKEVWAGNPARLLRRLAVTAPIDTVGSIYPGHKVLAMFPFYNEGEKLDALAGKILPRLVDKFIAVNDGSTDDGPAKLRGYGLTVLDQERSGRLYYAQRTLRARKRIRHSCRTGRQR